MTPELEGRASAGAEVALLAPGHWRLSIPAGPAGQYRLAQLDDYMRLPRAALRWRPPLRLSLRARASQAGLPGTWGFGLWNDPFSARLGVGGAARRLPALPNAAWFFYASPPNHLAFHDRHPAQGFLAATFAAPALPAPALALAAPALPLLAWPPTGRLLRRLAARLVAEDAAALAADPTAWHAFALDWCAGRVCFAIDGQTVFETAISPRGPLGLVLWIDNQYAAFPPDGRLRFGNLANPEPAWLELAGAEVE
jgi:hypothetical protein